MSYTKHLLSTILFITFSLGLSAQAYLNESLPIHQRVADLLNQLTIDFSTQKAFRIPTTAVGAVTRSLDTRVKGQPLVVYNPVAEVSPVSFTVFGVEPSAGPVATHTLKATTSTLENKVYQVKLDKNGDLASIIDKRYGRELVEQGKSFRLQALTDNVSKECQSGYRDACAAKAGERDNL